MNKCHTEKDTYLYIALFPTISRLQLKSSPHFLTSLPRRNQVRKLRSTPILTTEPAQFVSLVK
ncbi:MAG: hypothetical protein HC769_08685 [Cyanobacteria bacterium CRU_2_1]|nr:hypothetical protein [Cyanobacteria bacterium RU_5_0]NJR58916.1 hypothetical protein [Cyanobacteria bacterium CRU_2_1]